jgi:hypothetical protein
VTLLAVTLLVAAEAMEVTLLVVMEMEAAREKETPLMAVTPLMAAEAVDKVQASRAIMCRSPFQDRDTPHTRHAAFNPNTYVLLFTTHDHTHSTEICVG